MRPIKPPHFYITHTDTFKFPYFEWILPADVKIFQNM